jgi:hypothetical protein
MAGSYVVAVVTSSAVFFSNNYTARQLWSPMTLSQTRFFTSWYRYAVKPDNYSLLYLSHVLVTSYEFGEGVIGLAPPLDHPCTLGAKVCFVAICTHEQTLTSVLPENALTRNL